MVDLVKRVYYTTDETKIQLHTQSRTAPVNESSSEPFEEAGVRSAVVIGPVSRSWSNRFSTAALKAWGKNKKFQLFLMVPGPTALCSLPSGLIED